MGSTLTVRFEDGTVISAWESFELRDSFVDPLGSISMRARPPRHLIKQYNKYLQKGNLVAVQVNGVPQCTPIITLVTKSVDMNGVSFDVQAESTLTTPYEGNVDPTVAKKFQSDTPAYLAVLEALAPYNFEELCGDGVTNTGVMSGKPIGSSQTPVPLEELKHKQVEAQNNDTAYGYCARILARLGVVLRVDWEGKLLLAVPDYDQDVAYSLISELELPGKPGNRMMNLKIRDSNKGQFSEIVVKGAAHDSKTRKFAGKPVARVTPMQNDRVKEMLIRRGSSSSEADSIIENAKASSPYVDVAPVSPYVYEPEFPTYISPVAYYKPLFYSDKKSRDKAWCENVAKLMHGMRARNAFTIDCDVDGLVSSTGRIWTINTLAKVYVGMLDIDSEMWIMERSLRSGMQGETTHLKLIPKGALVLGEVPK